jgi:hypothetical protein
MAASTSATHPETRVSGALSGRWSVQRESGFLPGFGLSKRIRTDGHGWTLVFGIPLLPFRIVQANAAATADGEAARVSLEYRGIPIRDELSHSPSGWTGRGYLLGHEFCRFRLVPR